MAQWIRECVDAVNDPSKIPEISSMSDVAMSNIYKTSKEKAIKQYKRLLKQGMDKLRKNNHQILDEYDISQLHTTIFKKVMKANSNNLTPPKTHDKIDQRSLNRQKIYAELCDEIGHNENFQDIGIIPTSIIAQIFEQNRNLAMKSCNDYLNEYCNKHIEPMLDNPDAYDRHSVVTQFITLQNRFFDECRGSVKILCWNEFQKNRMIKLIKNFDKFKGLSEQIINAQNESMRIMEEQKTFENEYKEREKERVEETENIKKQIAEMEKERKEDTIMFEKKLDEEREKIAKMHEDQMAKLAKTWEESSRLLIERIVAVQSQNTEEIMKVMENMTQTINGLRPKNIT